MLKGERFGSDARLCCAHDQHPFELCTAKDLAACSLSRPPQPDLRPGNAPSGHQLWAAFMELTVSVEVLRHTGQVCLFSFFSRGSLLSHHGAHRIWVAAMSGGFRHWARLDEVSCTRAAADTACKRYKPLSWLTSLLGLHECPRRPSQRHCVSRRLAPLQYCLHLSSVSHHDVLYVCRLRKEQLRQHVYCPCPRDRSPC